MKDGVVDALDLRLIDALQRSPRASWTTLARLLGSSAVTLARRWATLTEAGAAWMTVAPNLSISHGSQAMGLALVEVRVRPGELVPTAESLARSCPEIATMEVTSGGRDLMLTVIAGDPDRLSDFLVGTLGTHESVVRMHAHPASYTHSDASGWYRRKHGVPEEEWPVRGGARPRPPRREVAEEIATVLAQDGRAPAARVAARLGVSTRTARAALAALVGSGELRFRTEIARPLSQWPVCVWYLIEAAASTRPRVVAGLQRMREVRAVMQTIGRADLAAVMWMRSLTDVQDVELEIERLDASTRISDRVLVMRTVKLMGRLLDEQGRATGFVPLPAYMNTLA